MLYHMSECYSFFFFFFKKEVCVPVCVYAHVYMAFYFCFFFLKFIYLFIYWLSWVFVAACGFSLVVASRGYSLLWCAGFSCCGAWALGTQASGVVARGLSSCGSRALEHRLSSCGARV